MIPKFSLKAIRSNLANQYLFQRDQVRIRQPIAFNVELAPEQKFRLPDYPYIYHFYRTTNVVSKKKFSNRRFNVTESLWKQMIAELNQQYKVIDGTNFFTYIDDHPNHIDPSKDIYDLPGGQFTVATKLPINWWAKESPFDTRLQCEEPTEATSYSLKTRDIGGGKVFKLDQHVNINVQYGYRKTAASNITINRNAWTSYCTNDFSIEPNPYADILPRRMWAGRKPYVAGRRRSKLL